MAGARWTGCSIGHQELFLNRARQGARRFSKSGAEPNDRAVGQRHETLQRLFVDFAGARLFYETGSSSPRYSWRFQTIINGGKGYRLNP
jgi:hypothetical protein